MMLNLPSIELIALIERVCAKRNFTQDQLAQELHIHAATISRMKTSGRIRKDIHRELLVLERDGEPTLVSPISQPIRIPFSVTIPRDSLRIAMDKNGNIEICGELVGMVNKEGK